MILNRANFFSFHFLFMWQSRYSAPGYTHLVAIIHMREGATMSVLLSMYIGVTKEARNGF